MNTKGNGLHYTIGNKSNGHKQENGKENGFCETRNGRFMGQRPQSAATKLSGFFLKSRKEQLEQQLVGQKEEISNLKELIDDLRSSLQLSDAQNLALQVALKRIAKAESRLPAAEKSQNRAIVKKSERQLENLISELREMSQTKYPTLASQNCSTSSSSQEQDQAQVSTTQVYLSGVQKELRGIATKLSRSPTASTIKDLSLAEAFDALVEAQAEIERMR